MAILRRERFPPGVAGTTEMLARHAVLVTAGHDRLRFVHGNEAAGFRGACHLLDRASPAQPPPQRRHGLGLSPAARRGGERR